MTDRSPRTPRRAGSLLLHLFGIALVLNSLNTYTFMVLFTRCSSDGIGLHCSGYGPFNGLVQALSDLMTINLLLRFMALIGFGLDVLALACLVLFALPALRRRLSG